MTLLFINMLEEKPAELPKKPANAYIRFVKENFDHLYKEMGNEKPQKVMAELAVMYNNLPDKERRKYEREFEEEQREYHRIMQSYNNAMSTPKRSTAGKRKIADEDIPTTHSKKKGRRSSSKKTKAGKKGGSTSSRKVAGEGTGSAGRKLGSSTRRGRKVALEDNDEDYELFSKGYNKAVDGRSNFIEEEHPRDESGQFVSKQKAGRSTSRKASKSQYKASRQSGRSAQKGEHHFDGRSEFREKEHPRDSSGKFISKEETGLKSSGTKRGARSKLSGSKTITSGRRGESTKRGQYHVDRRSEFKEDEHPRDDAGRFVSKEEDNAFSSGRRGQTQYRTSSRRNKEDEEGYNRENKSDFREEEHPRDDTGKFIPKEKAMVSKSSKKRGGRSAQARSRYNSSVNKGKSNKQEKSYQYEETGSKEAEQPRAKIGQSMERRETDDGERKRNEQPKDAFKMMTGEVTDSNKNKADADQKTERKNQATAESLSYQDQQKIAKADGEEITHSQETGNKDFSAKEEPNILNRSFKSFGQGTAFAY